VAAVKRNRLKSQSAGKSKVLNILVTLSVGHHLTMPQLSLMINGRVNAMLSMHVLKHAPIVSQRANSNNSNSQQRFERERVGVRSFEKF
jgi:hypothetical protein